MFYTADLETVWYSDNLDCFIVLGAEKDTLILAGVAAEQKIPLEMILSRLDIGRRTVRLGFSPLPEDASLFKAAPFDGGGEIPAVLSGRGTGKHPAGTAVFSASVPRMKKRIDAGFAAGL